jgi:beta-glucosidase
MTFAGGDRDTLYLSEDDENLILTLSESCDNCIVVIEGGSAVIMERWRKKVPAIIMAWYPGMEGGTAIADIILGKINPSGKLPIVFPKSSEQLPFFDSSAKKIEYGYYHGYKLMDKKGYEPAFPFGYGLSYNTYEYKNLRLNKPKIKIGEKIEITVDITNKGDLNGDEIVQLYIGYENSSVDRPKKELKGFTRVNLEPQETKTVSLNLDSNDLTYYNIENKQWVVEQIKYFIYVGPSSRASDLLEASFQIS